MNLQYSQKEIELFTILNCDHLLKSKSIDPTTLYRVASYRCFINNLIGPQVDALRRGCKAIDNCSVYRMTPEFDKLISFEKENDF